MVSRPRSLPCVRILAPATVLPTESPQIAPESGPADVMILAIARCCAWANDHSTYPTVPSVRLTADASPSLPSAPSPTPPLNVLAAPLPHAPPEAVSRYLWKFSDVPDSSLRNTTRIGSAGAASPPLRAARAGAFHGGGGHC